MSDTTQTTWDDWKGADVVDRDGNKVGSLGTVYVNELTGDAEWLTVNTGLFGHKETFVPVRGADADGDALRVPHTKAFLKDAPNLEPDHDHLEPEQTEKLYRYYAAGDEGGAARGRHEQPAGAQFAGRGEGAPEARSDAGTADDRGAALTRSEEELAVGTRRVETGKVRLVKYVVTENVTTTVPVRKEKVRIEREPITGEHGVTGASEPTISEGEREVTLHEEEIIVEKRVVPKERVRLTTEEEVSEQEVSEQLRKEQIKAERDEGTSRG